MSRGARGARARATGRRTNTDRHARRYGTYSWSAALLSRAREVHAYVRDPANRDARGWLRLDDGKGTLLGGYGNYRATHAVEAGARHSQAEQVRHTLLLSHDVLDLARDALPGLDALVEGALRQLPEAEADGHALVPLHGHILDQGSGTARFADHQDTEEEVAKGARAARNAAAPRMRATQASAAPAAAAAAVQAAIETAETAEIAEIAEIANARCARHAAATTIAAASSPASAPTTEKVSLSLFFLSDMGWSRG